MRRTQLRLGLVPSYMFVERVTGPQGYFAVPLAHAAEIFRDAYSGVSGLCRTVRGPSTSATPRQGVRRRGHRDSPAPGLRVAHGSGDSGTRPVAGRHAVLRRVRSWRCLALGSAASVRRSLPVRAGIRRLRALGRRPVRLGRLSGRDQPAAAAFGSLTSARTASPPGDGCGLMNRQHTAPASRKTIGTSMVGRIACTNPWVNIAPPRPEVR